MTIKKYFRDKKNELSRTRKNNLVQKVAILHKWPNNNLFIKIYNTL
jgi:hypothetical protein